MAYGVTSTGFVNKPLDVIKAELENTYQGIFGARFNVDPRSRNGQFIATQADRLDEVWKLAQAIYSSFTADGAAGAMLDFLASLTGTVRAAPIFSTVTLTAYGTPGTLLPLGRIVGITGSTTKFTTLAAATIGGGGSITVAAQATESGPLTANAGTLTVIDTPVSGWTAVTNLLDADVGSTQESDSLLRARRAFEVRAQGTSPLDAIIARVRSTVAGVTSVNGFENTSSVTDGDGLPPGSVEAVVVGGTDADIRAAIFASKAGGVEAHGTISGSVVDSQGQSHTIKFSRPVDLNVWLILNLIVDPALWPLDGATLVKEAVVEYGDTFLPGRDVIASRLGSEAFNVDGVMDVSSTLIAATTGAGPLTPTLSTTIPTSLRQHAKFDTSRIVVNVTNGTT